MTSPQREAPFYIGGDVGIGKSWFIAHKVMNLPENKYHKIIIDLRYTARYDKLGEGIEDEILDYLNHYVTGVQWLYPDFQSIYGDDFDPFDIEQLSQMRITAIDLLKSLSSHRLLRKKLRYYSLEHTPELIVVFDNIDHFEDKELLTVLDMCRRIIGYVDGVKVIIALRPSTILPKARTGVILGDSSQHHIVLKSPDVYDVLKKRFSTNYKGDNLSLDRKIPNTAISFGELLHIFKSSDHYFGMARVLQELCYTDSLPSPDEYIKRDREHRLNYNDSYDLRHYLKLFRTLLRSNNIESFKNIGKVYYGVHALLLKSAEPMSESKSYLFNLFDNELPNMKGNALIRYRVLEFCDKFQNMHDGTFDLLFDGLGYGTGPATKLLNVFKEAGLINFTTVESKEGQTLLIDAVLTTAGKRHLEIITNLWYIISVKTGMNIYSDCILYGEKAIEQAKLFVSNERLLGEYAKRGWVPEMNFIRFLMNQEYLEYLRAQNYCDTHPEMEEQLINLMSHLDSPAHNIHHEYYIQIKRWKQFRVNFN